MIVRKDNKIMLYCKGADTMIYERLDPSCSEMMELTTSHLNVSLLFCFTVFDFVRMSRSHKWDFGCSSNV